MSILSMHQCPECGQVSRFGRHAVVDIWPSGLPGVMARLRVAARRTTWLPRAEKAWDVAAKTLWLSAVTCCSGVVLLAVIAG